MIFKIASVILILAVTVSATGQFSGFSSANPSWMSMNPRQLQSPMTIPFPQCIQTEQATRVFQPNFIEQAFLQKLQEENSKLKQEQTRNANLRNTDIVDFDAMQLRSDNLNGALIARTATRLTEDIMKQLRCETNASISDQLDAFLKTIRLPANFCAFNPNANCNGLTRYRTITGVCNNLQRPYEGSSQTAYARLLSPEYNDGISSARSKSVLGGPLPSCREISLNMGSKPVFDTTFNNLFVAYGQFLIHDITLATPVTDSGRTPITSCTCASEDSSLCLVINIPSNDPFMAGQKCMSIPATAEAFSEHTCTLGTKDQSNGNSHYIDLSATYGSTKTTSHGLRLNQHGLLKTSKHPWSKFDLPPGQREGKTCMDSTSTQRCFAGGDSRLMENILLAGIQTQWVRIHNMFANELAALRPDWTANDDILYEEVRHILSGLHQRYVYDDWLPILIGREAAQRYTGHQGLFSQYNPNIPGVIFNEAATSALRLHTLVRDLLTRCKPNGELIDQVWLRDVSAKCKLAYDASNHGIDSILCGSMYDYGFAGDANYAQEIHHRLFETNENGKVTRHDIVSVNICRAREHGIAGYNAYRELCGLRRAKRFEDLLDTMTSEAVQKLATIYLHPDDIDLFIGTNHETPLPGGLVGPVSACIIGTQMKHLKFGDRFFYTHQGQFTPGQLQAIKNYPYSCFICHTTDIEKVPRNAFQPPNDQTNPLQTCNECPILDFSPWNLS